MGKITTEEALKKFDKRYFMKLCQEKPIEIFSKNVERFLKITKKAIENNESEEYFKKNTNDFLEKFYNDEKYSFNVYENIDSVIKYNDQIRVILEIKTPRNKAEMATKNNINVKALHEIILYYINLTRDVEGIKATRKGNIEVRSAIITNTQEWFVFDINAIEKIVDGELEKMFYKYKNNQLVYKRDNNKFYEDIKKYLEKIDINNVLQFVYFNINEVNTKDELINIYKILDKSYLMKEFTKRDISIHVLNNKFYQELLYIMGFKEVKENGIDKIVINHEAKGSLAAQIYNIEFNEKEHDEKTSIQNTFELAIIWINRMLFIKLFEGRLIAFNNDSKEYHILSNEKIQSFEDLQNLFFDIFGKKERNETNFSNQFLYIPYLNSSLFERFEIEKNEININQISNNEVLIKNGSVISTKNKKIKLLEYIIDFLNSYSFTAYQTEKSTIKTSKDIIDASVLGLIFEKLNGYQDGSFYTPSAVTEFMSREVVEKAIINIVNKELEWSCQKLVDIRNKIANNNEIAKKVNEAINNLRICDIAVGSGHFLVSILNQIIFFKKELGVLFKYGTDQILNEYDIEIIDDSLWIYDGQGKQFVYKKSDALSQKVQETLFNEKKNIIENCIFGVDLNPMAVSICQLRLWIELLKNAYYKNDVMETLPNIDINIKIGNSLINKVDFLIGKSIINENSSNKNTSESIKIYKTLVKNYKETKDKAIKKEIKTKIKNIKESIYVMDDKMVVGENNKLKIITERKDDIYKDAFEWAIEFPEIIDDKCAFNGFDCIIGNPPYIGEKNHKEIFRQIAQTKFGKKYYVGKMDLFYFFFHRGLDLLKNNGQLAFITTNYFPTATYGKKLRVDIKERTKINKIINFNEIKIFETALGQHNMITFLTKTKKKNTDLCNSIICNGNYLATHNQLTDIFNGVSLNAVYLSTQQNNLFEGEEEYIRIGGVINDEKNSIENILQKLSVCTMKLKDIAEIKQGIVSGADKYTNKHEEKYHLGISKNTGIFILNKNEVDSLGLSKKEQQYIKKIYKNSDIESYRINYSDLKYCLYITKNEKEEEIPNVIKHLEKFKVILKDKRETIEGKIPWYSLNWSRKKELFEAKYKIVNSRRSKDNSFALETKGYYEQSDIMVTVVKEKYLKEYHPKYVLALLNSKLYYAWLKIKGKVKGNQLEIYGKPLEEIPIPTVNVKTMNEIVDCCDEIIKDKNEKNINLINEKINKIFNLNEEEIKQINEYYKDVG